MNIYKNFIMKNALVPCGEDYHRETERKINEN